MTEAEWDACDDPTPMLEFLRGKAGDRKLRLFAVACCRHLLHKVRVDPRDVHAVDVAELYVDKKCTAAEMESARLYVPGPPSARRTAAFACRDAATQDTDGGMAADGAAENAAWAVGEHIAFLAGAASDSLQFAAAREGEKVTQARFLRDVLGPLGFRPFLPLPAMIVAWNDGCLAKLATAIYDDRAFDRLPLLADALEDAGCADADILGHCRGPGPHVRGCWVVDLLLGKS